MSSGALSSSPIGVRIFWAPNPLRTVVELDNVGKRLLRYCLKIENLEELIVSADIALDPKHHEWLVSIGKAQPKTPDEILAYARRELKADYALGDAEWYGKKIDARIDEQLDSYVTELAGKHNGDCICVACSCLKCRAEGLLGVGTIAGLGKHSAYKIEGAFKSESSGPEVSIEEAVARLRDYRPVYRANPRWPEEDWQKHVPRWIEEGRRAYEWLETYQREHFEKGGTLVT